MTILILVLGTILIMSATGRAARERAERLERVAIGDPAAEVTPLLGVEPVTCPADSLEHLRASFPDGWTTASMDVALETLGEMTAERWVFPLEPGEEILCGATGQRTEIGVGASGQVVWLVRVLGRTPVDLPPSLAPSGVEEAAADSI